MTIIIDGTTGISPSLAVTGALTVTGGVDKLTSATGVVSVAAATAPSVGQVLMATSGTVATWQTPAVTAPAGSNTQVQFNNSGAFGASSGLVFDGTSLGVGGTPVNSRKLLVSTASQTDISINAGSSAYGQLLFGYTGADNKGIVAYNNSDNSMQFYTNTTERARINSSGQVLINAVTDAAAAGARLHITGAGSQTACSIKIGTDGYSAWYFVNTSGTAVGNIVINTSTTAYNTTSDYRLKNNVSPMTGALNKVSQLKPVNYKWNVDESDGEGFIAHELAEVCPHAVTGKKDEIETYTDDKGNEQTRPKYQSIDTSFLIATLTAAIQELNAKFEAYKSTHP